MLGCFATKLCPTQGCLRSHFAAALWVGPRSNIWDGRLLMCKSIVSINHMFWNINAHHRSINTEVQGSSENKFLLKVSQICFLYCFWTATTEVTYIHCRFACRTSPSCGHGVATLSDCHKPRYCYLPQRYFMQGLVVDHFICIFFHWQYRSIYHKVDDRALRLYRFYYSGWTQLWVSIFLIFMLQFQFLANEEPIQ